MQLRHISRGLLIMFARGDAWKVSASLQSGQPAQAQILSLPYYRFQGY